jgi:hypothetical protein
MNNFFDGFAHSNRKFKSSTLFNKKSTRHKTVHKIVILDSFDILTVAFFPVAVHEEGLLDKSLLSNKSCRFFLHLLLKTKS